MAQSITETAYAKINLALHIRARRDDGYHELETIFAFVDDGDTLAVETAETLALEIDGPFSKGLEIEGNLVLKAAKALQSYAGIDCGARIKLTKNLPVASGIGGGSADAAATLRALNRLWDLSLTDIELASIGTPLGADVAACVISRTCVGTGVGEKLHLTSDDSLIGLLCLLINPGVAVSTGTVFAAWSGVDKGPLLDAPTLEAAQKGRNDLYGAAVNVAPQISHIIQELDKSKPVMARMSGSGATCFALFDTLKGAQSAQQNIISKWPDYWTMIGKLRGENND